MLLMLVGCGDGDESNQTTDPSELDMYIENTVRPLFNDEWWESYNFERCVSDYGCTDAGASNCSMHCCVKPRVWDDIVETIKNYSRYGTPCSLYRDVDWDSGRDNSISLDCRVAWVKFNIGDKKYCIPNN